ncbi:MAG: DUF1572 domain-containing protein, partial [Bacteroidota bacterium]
MESAQQLSARFREVMLSGKWIANTNFHEQVADLRWQEATRQIGTLNTIAALTFHLGYYIKGVQAVLDGGELTIRDKFSFDCPPIGSAADWEALRSDTLGSAERFAQSVAQLTDEQLDSVFVKAAYGTYRRNL